MSFVERDKDRIASSIALLRARTRSMENTHQHPPNRFRKSSSSERSPRPSASRVTCLCLKPPTGANEPPRQPMNYSKHCQLQARVKDAYAHLRPKLEATFEDLRFDYEPRHERITFRMPLRIHDIFTHFISEAIHEAVREVGRNNEDVHRFTENVIKGSTSDINTSEKKKKRSADEKEDDPVKKRRSPDSQSIYVGAQQPRIVIEVAASQDAKQLSKLAKGYIHDTWGDIKAVLCFALNKSNGSSLSLWKAKYTWCRFSGARHRLLFKPRRRADHIPYSPNIRQRV
ncbi:hypothetical protein IWW34DRAFT_910858 [Fusarium oxysporum f. sp. albedinis]|nr:hypothetical protein IWW34DRAFT_910858 [Fusarium oxysporum f. sp. albedinis]